MITAAGKGLVCTMLAAGGAALGGGSSDAVGTVALVAPTLSTLMGGVAGNMAREILAEHSDALVSAVLRRRPGIDGNHHILFALRQSHLKALDQILAAYNSAWPGDFDVARRREAERFSSEARRFLKEAGLGKAAGAGPATALETAVFGCLPASFNAALAARGPLGRDAARDEAGEARGALEAVVLAELAMGSGSAGVEIPTAFRSLFAREREGWFDLFVRDAAASLKRNADFRHIWTAEQLARIESDTRAVLAGLDGLVAAVAGLEDRNEARHRELRDRTEEILATLQRDKGVDPDQLRPILERLGHTDIPVADIPRVLGQTVDQLLARAASPMELHNDGPEIDLAIATARRLLGGADITGALGVLDDALDDDAAWRRSLEREAEATAHRQAMARGRARAFFEKAAIQRLTLDHEGACESLRQGLELDVAETDRWLDLGDELLLLGQTGDALKAFEAGMTRSSVEEGTAHCSSACAHVRIGGVRVVQGDLAGAMSSYEAAIEIAARLSAADPSNAYFQRVLAVAHRRIGGVRESQGDLAGALASYEAAMAISARLGAAYPSDVRSQRDLELVHIQIGGVRESQGDLAGALASYEAAMAISARLGAAYPSDVRLQQDLALAHIQIGGVRESQGDLAGALASYEAAMAISARLGAAYPSDVRLQQDLALAHIQLGGVLEKRGDRADALASYEAAMAISARLSAADPFNAHSQSDLALAHYRIGRVQLDRGDLTAALEEFKSAMTICACLAAADPLNVNWQHGLALACCRIGQVQHAKGDMVGALANIEEGIAILRHLAIEVDPLDVIWQRDLAVVQNLGNEVLSQRMSPIKKRTGSARKRIAEVAREVLLEEKLDCISWGDGILGTIAARAGVAPGQPLKAMERVLAALGRAPDLFEPGRLRRHDWNGRPRTVRTFRLRTLPTHHSN